MFVFALQPGEGSYGKLVPRFNHKMAASYRYFSGASVDIRYVPVPAMAKQNFSL